MPDPTQDPVTPEAMRQRMLDEGPLDYDALEDAEREAVDVLLAEVRANPPPGPLSPQ